MHLAAEFLGLLEPAGDVVPVGNVPNGLYVGGAHVFILQVVGMLPDVNAEEGDQTSGGLQGVLVGQSRQLELAGLLVVA